MFIKKIGLALCLLAGLTPSLMAQQTDDYSKNWQKAEAFEKKGLPKSALSEVMLIYNKALAAGNDAQQIKACIYQIRYRSQVEEDSQEKNIFFVDTLIAKAKAPAKNILQSMQAQLYWQYLQNHRWQFRSRTSLQEEKSKDIDTWSLEKLYSTIAAGYSASLSNPALLKSTTIGSFDPIISKGTNSRPLRPTLCDLLAQRALEFYKTDENSLTRPAYQFAIRDEEAFAPAARFINFPFPTKDTASLQRKALLLYQDLLRFHSNDTNPDALLDLDLQRLAFVYQYAVMDNKEPLFETALKDMETRFSGNTYAAQAMYLRANLYYERGQQYKPNGPSTQQYEIKRARELCVQAEKLFPESEGGINAHNLISSIDMPGLHLVTEKVNLPGQPFRTLVKYRNVKAVYFRLVKITREELKKINRQEYDKTWAAVTALKPLKTWSVNLPDPQDYQEHSAEAKVEGAEPGLYLVLAGMKPDFSLGNNVLARQAVYVSNISFVNNYGGEYYVLHRDNGTPLAGAKIQCWQQEYNYQTGNYDEKKAEALTADKNGYFKIKESKEYRQYFLQIQYNNEELFLDESNYAPYSYNAYETPRKPTTFLFTDRAIYRPGQLLYFKGIMLQTEKDAAKSSLLTNYSTTVQLKDANGQKVAELQVTTNSFGSYKGSFKLPEGLLNGTFSLYDTAAQTSHGFSVEEYKRPKFFVEIPQPKGSYRVNDSITVTGTAKAFAGNNIDGAKVTYRVTRKTRMPVWWFWGYYARFGGNNEATEISNGELTTDANGSFHIVFKAIPDESVDKKSQPVFYYEINADITDINGETRSGQTDVAVAYQALQIAIDGPEELPADSLKQLLVRTTNINNLYEKASVTVSVSKVKSPQQVYRPRLWDMPDQFLMSKEEYQGYFPWDVYKDEDLRNNWPLGDRVQDKTDTTREDGQWKLSNNKWEPGWYKVVAITKDKYGEDVRAEKYIRLTAPAGSRIYDAIALQADKTIAEPGDKINYSIATGFTEIWLIQTLSKMNAPVQSSYRKISATQPALLTETISEKDRGGMEIGYFFVIHNRVYTGNLYFDIPWTNKQLTISYETFRDKLLPGSKEKWKVKISGAKGEKVAAELLAGMYDASLDQFKPQSWRQLNIWPGLYSRITWQYNNFSTVNTEQYSGIPSGYKSTPDKSYDELISPGDGYFGGGYRAGMVYAVTASPEGVYKSAPPPPPVADRQLSEVLAGKVAGLMDVSKKDADGARDEEKRTDSGHAGNGNTSAGGDNIQVRKNFNETAFFFPDLTTDADGNVEFSFTMPEALTKWKLMTLAHTRDLASAYSEKTTITQKPLMVQPNAPRFVREGDQMEFTTKIVNLADSEVTGTVQLELLDAATGKPVDGWLKNVFPNQYFTIAAGQSSLVKFPMELPYNFNSALSYRIKAITRPNKAGETFSDGEEMALPVLTNRMLVTESLPLNMRHTSSKQFRFEKLINSAGSTSISHQALTLEYTSNPAWYAVQALPYLMEYPYECAEQTFNRYYANTLASYISRSVPKIKTVFEKWKNTDTAALLSNLQKNEELKSALLQETPWVLEAQNESQQKKNIALLFDMVRMGNESTKALNKLKELQSPNGGFVWFKGGQDDPYMTQYIITGIGHLRKLNALDEGSYQQLKPVIEKALPYLDKKLREDYDYLVKYKVKLSSNNLGYMQIQYLYMRSFFPEIKIAAATGTAYNYYRGQAQKYWLSNSKYMQALIALGLHRTGDTKTPAAIIRSLKENSISKEEMGMYWKEWNTGGYYWYQAPIESQALMIEAFNDIDKNTAAVDDLKTWLLKQKQTQNWKTTRATSEACYALLLGGSNWLAEEKEVSITMGTTTISSNDQAAEAGTGYFKKRIEGDKVSPAMGNITVTIKPLTPAAGSSSTSWGAAYWQYFEDLDKITPAETPLKLSKKLFLEKNSDRGPQLVAVADGAELKVGDKVKVRIELRADRDMEYLHMKDMRAACMEPVNVISQYKYQDGLGYYESTKDASTNFFFGWLPRGTYVFEYELFVTHTGNFSNGITSIQCMYAPEFTAHSEGIRVNVE